MKFKSRSNEKVEMQLTSMIDIIFLLLIFFVMTFKIAAQEGDFNIRMPIGGGSGPTDTTNLPIKLRLRSNTDGELVDIVVDDTRSFGNDFGKLRAFILQQTGGSAPPNPEDGPEVEIDLDYNLRYAHVISAISAITGQRQGDKIDRLVERIKFAPPRKPQ
ncbi:MAG: biopolymer transporter ExbD [Planctomycetes bacterium]|jgi:biopolymer transport protein ExbD|nr:biopolymer transporter ExbD [Planctomycetota bacterium]